MFKEFFNVLNSKHVLHENVNFWCATKMIFLGLLKLGVYFSQDLCPSKSFFNFLASVFESICEFAKH